MNKLRLPLFLAVALVAFLAGCTSPGDRYSSIPQDRPANWEGQIPGMGQIPGSGAR